MDDKDIMNPEIYEIKPDNWEVLEDNESISYRLLAYKLSSWSEDTHLIVNVNKENKTVIINWNSKDFVFPYHKAFFRFDDDLPDNLDCKSTEDRLSSIVLDSNYVYESLLNHKLLIIRASLEKSKTTRVFNISKFREVIKNN